MYYLTKMCYCCLEQKVNLINIDSSSSTDAELVRAVTCIGLNVYWLDTCRTISICEKCSLRARETLEFVSLCHKNSKIVQSYLNLLNNEKVIGSEAQLVLQVKATADTIYKIKLENREEDETEEYEEVIKYPGNKTMNTNSVNQENEQAAVTAEKQYQIKREIKVEHESVVCPQISLEETELLFNQFHSELDIKQDVLYDAEESEEECDKNHSAEKQVKSELSLNDCDQTSNNVTANRTVCTRDLKMHMSIQTEKKRFECSTCNKCFCTKAHLTSHAHIHINAKPFVCLICNKGFKQKSQLISHSRIHTDEKPFKCSTCNKCFRRKGHLNQHIWVHSNEKPFVCSVCNTGFKHKSNVNRHMKLHTNE